MTYDLNYRPYQLFSVLTFKSILGLKCKKIHIDWGFSPDSTERLQYSPDPLGFRKKPRKQKKGMKIKWGKI